MNNRAGTVANCRKSGTVRADPPTIIDEWWDADR